MADAPTAMTIITRGEARQRHKVVKILGLVVSRISTCNSIDDALGGKAVGLAGAFGI